MSGQPDCLLVDIGNTRVKYAWLLETGCVSPPEAGSLENVLSLLPQAKNVLVSNVSEPAISLEIEQACTQLDIGFQDVKTESETFGIRNGYKNFHTMGVDRWLAVLATRDMTELPYAVIDVGTAATCDFVDGQRHLGGWIAPGFELMRQSLFSNTENVFGDDTYPSSLEAGTSTPDCVNMGCLSAVQGLFENARRLMREQFEDYRIFVTGGGQSLLAELADEKTELVSDLVFKGLSRFYKNTH